MRFAKRLGRQGRWANIFRKNPTERSSRRSCPEQRCLAKEYSRPNVRTDEDEQDPNGQQNIVQRPKEGLDDTGRKWNGTAPLRANKQRQLLHLACAGQHGRFRRRQRSSRIRTQRFLLPPPTILGPSCRLEPGQVRDPTLGRGST